MATQGDPYNDPYGDIAAAAAGIRPSSAIPEPGRYGPYIPKGSLGARINQRAGIRSLAGGLSRAPNSGRAMQNLLRSQGYHLAQDGIVGPITRSAMRAMQRGVSAKVWNAQQGALARVKPAARPAGKSAPNAFGGLAKGVGAALAPLSTDATGSTQSGSSTSFDAGLNQLQSLLGQLGAPISLASKTGQPTQFGQLLNAATATIDPGLAAQIANGEYDPQIQNLELQQQIQGRQSAQNMADIANWYAQVSGAANAAQAGDAKMSANAPGDIANIAKSLAASIGGSANPGSEGVSAAGANDAAYVTAVNNAQGQYDNIVPALLKADQAATSQRETSINQANALQLAAQLAGVKGQKAGALAQEQLAIAGQNRALDAQKLQSLMGVRQYNNQLAGQKVNMKLAIQQMIEAAPSLGVKLQGQELTNVLTAAKIQNMSASQQITLAKLAMSGKLDSAKLTSMGITNRLHQSEILKNLSGLNKQVSSASTDLTKLLGNTGYLTGSKPGTEPGTFILPKNADVRQVAAAIGTVIRNSKIPQAQRRQAAYFLFSKFRNSAGKPWTPGKGWWSSL